ncbi:MAG: hypothetical protein ACTSYS_13870 [Promethearchaeota archaeon]
MNEDKEFKEFLGDAKTALDYREAIDRLRLSTLVVSIYIITFVITGAFAGEFLIVSLFAIALFAIVFIALIKFVKLTRKINRLIEENNN